MKVSKGSCCLVHFAECVDGHVAAAVVQVTIHAHPRVTDHTCHDQALLLGSGMNFCRPASEVACLDLKTRLPLPSIFG